jgi:hypothetical protein
MMKSLFEVNIGERVVGGVITELRFSKSRKTAYIKICKDRDGSTFEYDQSTSARIMIFDKPV